MEPTYDFSGIVSSISGATGALAAKIPELVGAALAVAVLVFAARLGWRLVRSLAGR